MIKLKTQYRVIIWGFAFILYAFFAARPVPKETVLVPQWLYSLETAYETNEPQGELYPFKMGDRFGYVSQNGHFAINKKKTGYVLLSSALWAEFADKPDQIEIKTPRNQTALTIKKPSGYPFFYGTNVFLLLNEQNAIAKLDDEGNELWRYDFSSTITCIDVSDDFLLAGLLDGTVELITMNGDREFFYEVAGSRLTVIYGCALSADGQKIAVISGQDNQRFILFERFGTNWRISYHKFLGRGFNRPLRVAFVNGDASVIFERQDGIGVHDIAKYDTALLNIAGRVQNIEEDGSTGLMFIIMEEYAGDKRLIMLDSAARVKINAPFYSQWSFLDRHDNQLFVGAGNVLAAFTIEKR